MITSLKRKTIKARKKHRCDLCGGFIKKGERYHYESNVYDRDLYEFKAHLHCMGLADDLDMFNKMDDEGLTGEAFSEFIWEEYNYSFPDEELTYDTEMMVSKLIGGKIE